MPRKRKRDQDGIFTRPDSPFWWASYTDSRSLSARRSTGIRREADPEGTKAKAVRAQWILETETTDGQQKPLGRTFDDLMVKYLAGPSLEKRASERDKYSVKQLFPVFTGKELEALTGADVRSYIAKRKADGVQAATINRELGVLSAALNWARRELEWILPNPVQGRRLRDPAVRTRWLTKEEAEKLYQTAKQIKLAPHLADFIQLGLHTGMRPGEMLGLEWRRVNLQVGLIYLEAIHQKNGEIGSVPLNSMALAAILARARFRAQHCLVVSQLDTRG